MAVNKTQPTKQSVEEFLEGIQDPGRREGEWFLCGFSPRKQNLTLYVMGYLEVLEKLIMTSIRRLKEETG